MLLYSNFLFFLVIILSSTGFKSLDRRSYIASLFNDLKPVDESIITKKRENYYKVTYGFGLNKIPETTQFGKI